MLGYGFYIYPSSVGCFCPWTFFRATDWTIYHGPNEPGLATDSLCNIWGCGWTISLLYCYPLIALCLKCQLLCNFDLVEAIFHGLVLMSTASLTEILSLAISKFKMVYNLTWPTFWGFKPTAIKNRHIVKVLIIRWLVLDVYLLWNMTTWQLNKLAKANLLSGHGFLAKMIKVTKCYLHCKYSFIPQLSAEGWPVLHRGSNGHSRCQAGPEISIS